MSKPLKRIDHRQMGFDFDRRIEEYASLKQEILAGAPPRQVKSYEKDRLGLTRSPLTTMVSVRAPAASTPSRTSSTFIHSECTHDPN
jgi:hypothetical protein